MARGSNSTMRGRMIGAGPVGEAERGEVAPRVCVSYWCQHRHETTLSFAADPSVIVPDQTDCRRCGSPAGTDPANPPATSKAAPYKTHLAYVRERRSQAEGDALVDEALRVLRSGRRR
ncbi:MAG: RNA polymerase-binding protein RbpA [Mycobacteriales bacterium]